MPWSTPSPTKVRDTASADRTIGAVMVSMPFFFSLFFCTVYVEAASFKLLFPVGAVEGLDWAHIAFAFIAFRSETCSDHTTMLRRHADTLPCPM